MVKLIEVGEREICKIARRYAIITITTVILRRLFRDSFVRKKCEICWELATAAIMLASKAVTQTKEPLQTWEWILKLPTNSENIRKDFNKMFKLRYMKTCSKLLLFASHFSLSFLPSEFKRRDDWIFCKDLYSSSNPAAIIWNTFFGS